MTIKVPKISTIVAGISILTALGVGYGWMKTSARNSVEKEMMRTEISALKLENKDQQDEINLLKTSVSVFGSNVELLLRHFGIEPARAEKDTAR